MDSDFSDQYKQQLESGYISLKKGDYRQLSEICIQLAESYPKEIKTWLLLARFGLQVNNFDYATRAIEQASRLSQNDTELELIKASLQIRLGNTSEAVKIVENCLSKQIDSSEILSELARLSYQLNRIEWSRDFYQQAIEKTPNNSELYYSLAASEQYLGNLDESLANCELALKIAPNHHEAIFLRSNLFKQSESSNHIDELKSFISRQSEDSLAKVMGCYALAKEYEDIENYKLSFEWRAKGASLYRKRFRYDVKEDVEFMKRIAEVYRPSLFENPPSFTQGNQAIFIIGLPRTGSTLVERIITSHNNVESAGELTHFPNLLSKFIQQAQQSGTHNSNDLVELTKSFNFEQLGHEYLALAERNRTTKKLFVDKFPQNALYAGLIHRALPDAKIILVERDPMDVCYAMYKQLFTDIYQFSYDLEELADYYIAHQSLMTHWKQCLADNVLTVKYEDLISDYETNSRRLIAFCGLEWQDQCANFEKNPQFSATASAAQVRKPLYSSSVGMWRKYEAYLAPILNRLVEQGKS